MYADVLHTVLTWLLGLLLAAAILASVRAQRKELLALTSPLLSPFAGTRLDIAMRTYANWGRLFIPYVRLTLFAIAFISSFLYQLCEVLCGVFGAVAQATGEWAKPHSPETPLTTIVTSPDAVKAFESRLRELIASECAMRMCDMPGPSLSPTLFPSFDHSPQRIHNLTLDD